MSQRIERSGAFRLIGYLGIFASCAHPASATWRHPGAAEWDAARLDLQQLRASVPTTSYVESIRATLLERRSGKSFDGRGALAVAPGRALRMILVGIGGTTLLDAWVTPDRWRFAVPPIGVVRRGARDDPPDLPIAFLRWWFFAPFQGALVAAAAVPGQARWVLRVAGGVMELTRDACDGGERIRAQRRASDRSEIIEECRMARSATVHYQDETGVRVDLVTQRSSATPDEAAFVDPDVPVGVP